MSTRYCYAYQEAAGGITLRRFAMRWQRRDFLRAHPKWRELPPFYSIPHGPDGAKARAFWRYLKKIEWEQNQISIPA